MRNTTREERERLRTLCEQCIANDGNVSNADDVVMANAINALLADLEAAEAEIERKSQQVEALIESLDGKNCPPDFENTDCDNDGCVACWRRWIETIGAKP